MPLVAHLGRPKCKIFRQLHSKTNLLDVASRSVTVRCHEFKCPLMAYFVERVAWRSTNSSVAPVPPGSKFN